MVITKYILQGGGEHARVVLDCLLSNGEEVVALFDPKYNGSLMGVQQLGKYNPQFEPTAKAIVAIGDNALRKKVAENTDHAFGKAIHRSVILSTSAIVNDGAMLLHGSIVQAQATIGSHAIINTGAQVDHDCVIEDFVHIAPGAVLCGTVIVEEGAMIGARAVVIPGKRIGKWSIVGAGAVVIDDVPDYSIVVGSPARVITSNIL